MESQHCVLGGVGSGSVSDRSAIARHDASFFKLVEWSEQLRSVTSVRLDAVRRRVQIRPALGSGCEKRKLVKKKAVKCC